YLMPGLERGFGRLWPLVVAAALAGAVAAASRLIGDRRPRTADGAPTRPPAEAHRSVLGWLGIASLIGMIAYLFTPLGAAGPEGSPTAFAINLRFVIPAMILGLVLLPLSFALKKPSSSW